MASVTPYLIFNGNCEAAFTLYRSVFGGDFATLSRLKNAPGNPHPGDGEKIMHVSLPIGGGTLLLGGDRPSSMGAGRTGDNFSISVDTPDRAETDRIFNGLSAGGTVTMPLADTFWGAYFGMCTDKFGINWMISCDNKAAK